MGGLLVRRLGASVAIALDEDEATGVLLVGEEIWLIDSGVASSQEFILDYVKKIGRKPEEISLLNARGVIRSAV